MNYFVEGIQGSGKTTMLEKMSKEDPSLQLLKEGDYSPIELAWCAYVSASQYEMILNKYESIMEEIKKNTVQEGDKYVIMYTRIITDVPGFYQELEQYEIYNGRKNRKDFEEIVLQRFRNWDGEKQLFECSFFQNIIDNQILYLQMSDDEIFEFYKKVEEALAKKEYHIIYLCVDHVRATEEIIKKERSDENGNELWFSSMMDYLEAAPYSKVNGYKGMDGLVKHLEHRAALEKRILRDIFEGHYKIVERKICQ